MANLVHDVSRELRDPHGKWTVGGAKLRRVAKDVTAGKAKTREEITGHVQNLPKGTGKTIGGHRVDLTQGGKYRVGLKKEGGGRDTKVYGSPHDASRAIHEGSHHEAGDAARVAGGARTRGSAPSRAPSKNAPTYTPGRYTIVLTGKPNKDRTHYGVHDNHTGKNIIEGVHHSTARETVMDRNASSAPARRLGRKQDSAIHEHFSRQEAGAGEQPYRDTPEAQLREMVTRGGNKAATEELTRRMLANEKTRVEAENKSRHGPGGSTTVRSGPMGGVPAPDLGHQNQRAGQAAALRRIRGAASPESMSPKELDAEITRLNRELRGKDDPATEKQIQQLVRIRGQKQREEFRRIQAQRAPRGNETAAALAAVRARKGKTRG